MLLFVAIWLGGFALSVAMMRLAFLVGQDTQHRHLEACIEASTQGGTSAFHDGLCETVTGVDR
jgi:hypothetical protein